MMSDLFNELKSDNYLKNLDKTTFCSKLADKMTMLNKIHPFREGNGRTKRIFISQLSQAAGYDINWNACNKKEWIIADQCAFDSLRDYGKADTSYLEHLLDRAVAPIARANNEQKAVPENDLTEQGKLSPAFLQMVRNMPGSSATKMLNMLDSGADMQ